MTEPFNPLGMENLGLSITTAMLKSNETPMSTIPTFSGAGIYAIYYRGTFPAYKALVENTISDFEIPIYVGRAVPQGARKGALTTGSATTRALCGRIKQHSNSIRSVTNLDIGDFWCRWLVIEPIWIPLGETVMISMFKPLWNQLIDGFGNHDPGKGRHAGVRSRWDTLHPGRSWAPKFPPRLESEAEILLDIEEYMRARYQV